MEPTRADERAPPTRGPRRRLLARAAVVALLVLGVASFYALGLHRYASWEQVRSHLDAARAAVARHPGAALALFFLAYVLAAALSLPVAAVLSVAAGALFGRWLGTGLVVVAATLGATLAFLGSRFVLRDGVQRRFGARLGPINRGVERDGAWYLFTLRLVPAFPFWLVNLGMGLTPLPVQTFAWVSLLGMLPGTFLYVSVGAALGDIGPGAPGLSAGELAGLAVLGLLPLALRWLWRGKGR